MEADRVYCGGVYGMLPPPPSEFAGTPTPSEFRRGAGRQAASQEEDLCVVAAARPQGTASSQRRLFDRRQQIVPWYGMLPSPMFETPARFVGKYRTGSRKLKRAMVKRRGRTLHVEKSLD